MIQEVVAIKSLDLVCQGLRENRLKLLAVRFRWLARRLDSEVILDGAYHHFAVVFSEPMLRSLPTRVVSRPRNRHSLWRCQLVRHKLIWLEITILDARAAIDQHLVRPLWLRSHLEAWRADLVRDLFYFDIIIKTGANSVIERRHAERVRRVLNRLVHFTIAIDYRLVLLRHQINVCQLLCLPNTLLLQLRVSSDLVVCQIRHPHSHVCRQCAVWATKLSSLSLAALDENFPAELLRFSSHLSHWSVVHATGSGDDLELLRHNLRIIAANRASDRLVDVLVLIIKLIFHFEKASVIVWLLHDHFALPRWSRWNAEALITELLECRLDTDTLRLEHLFLHGHARGLRGLHTRHSLLIVRASHVSCSIRIRLAELLWSCHCDVHQGWGTLPIHSSMTQRVRYLSLLQVRAELLHLFIRVHSPSRRNTLIVIHATHSSTTNHTLIVNNYIVTIWVL